MWPAGWPTRAKQSSGRRLIGSRGRELAAIALFLVIFLPFAPAIGLPSVAHASSGGIDEQKAAIIDYLRTVRRERRTLVGVQVDEHEAEHACTSYDRVAKYIGRSPAMMGLELMGVIVNSEYRAAVVDRARSHTRAGGIVTLSWHARNPLLTCPTGEAFSCIQNTLSREQFDRMLTPGTPENALWLADVQVIADILRQLQENNVVVLFRPYHEMSNTTIWWGGQPSYSKLWDTLYDELENKKNLRNLIWVMSFFRDTAPSKLFSEVRNRPDFVGLDLYTNDQSDDIYRRATADVTEANPGAPFALTEVGRVPSRKTLDIVDPIWVLMWGRMYVNPAQASALKCNKCNSIDDIRHFFDEDRIITLDMIPSKLHTRLSAPIEVENVERHFGTCD